MNIVQYAGEITLTSSNSTESISTISNMSSFYPVKFLPNSALMVTFNATPVASISTNQIAMPSPSFTAIGSNYDYMILARNKNGFVQQLDAQNYN